MRSQMVLKPLQRSFSVTNRGVNRIVRPIKQDDDLIDTGQRISIEDEDDGELFGDEFCAIERCSERASAHTTAAATPDPSRTSNV